MAIQPRGAPVNKPGDLITTSGGVVTGGYDSTGAIASFGAPPVTRYTNPTPPTTPTTNPSPATPLSTTPTAMAPIPVVNKPTMGTVDENQIRKDVATRMQNQIDAINASFVNLQNQEQIAGQDRSGQTRAINSRSGLMGSDFGQANAEKTTQFNKSQMQGLEAEKNAKLSAIMANIEDRASAEIRARKEEALGQYNRDSESFQQAQEQARGDLQALAKTGVALESLNPAQKAAILKQAGYEDPNFGEIVYNSMKPKAQQIEYKFEKLADGQGLFYGVDPVTGQLVTKNVKVDIPDGFTMTIAPDGTPVIFNKSTGEAKIAEGFGQGQLAKPEDPTQLYGGLTKEQRTELQRIQGNVRQDPDVKDFVQIRDGYERVQTGAGMDNAQGDLALLFGFMKILDPNSVVRETEFDNAEQAQGTLQKIFNIPSKFLEGTRLTTEGRQYFANAAKELYARKEQSYQRASDFYGGQLDAFGIPKELGLRDFATTIDAGAPGVADFSQILKGLVEQGYSWEEANAALDAEVSQSPGFSLVGGDTNKAQKEIDRIAEAIGKYESGGRYTAMGPTVTSGMYKGDKAYGKYQVMGKNIPSWTKQALGRTMTPEQFIKDTKAQDQVARYMMGKHYDKYGNVADVASIWFSGRPVAKAGNAKDVIGTTVPKYVRNVEAIYNSLG